MQNCHFGVSFAVIVVVDIDVDALLWIMLFNFSMPRL
jgi:hypothetical protein